ncbi:MAG: GNAT family N-acetyltransferase [Desulfobacterales bacterium]|jgi:predicted N-acetyltransferase YhbS
MIIASSGHVNPIMNLIIDNLTNHPEFIPKLVYWFHAEWGHFHPQTTIEQRISSLKERCVQTSGLPLTLIARMGDHVIGTASLIKHDMEVHLELTPWLSSVYVDTEHRRQGIGSQLVKRIVQEAANINAKILYLFTPDRENFYARMGWQLLYREKYRGQQVVLMEIRTAAK